MKQTVIEKALEKLKAFIKRNSPPGSEASAARLLIIAPCVSLAASLGFWLRFGDAYRNLFERNIFTGALSLKKHAMMPGFSQLTGKAPAISLLFSLSFAAGMAAAFYRSFKTETKSIYLMKRLPDRFELHRRCLAVPALAIALSLLVSVFAAAIQAAVYMNRPPAETIFPISLEEFVRSLI